MNEILSKMLSPYREALSICNFSGLQEIRFRVNRPVMLYYSKGTRYLAKSGGETNGREQAIFATAEDIEKLLSIFCRSAVYAHQEELKDCFITLSGGHRVGVAGKAVLNSGKVENLKHFSGVNIRIAGEFQHCADSLLLHIVQDKRIYNSIIIAPPGVGKTTFLRDLARGLSARFKVSVIDERSELAASKNGVPQFDIGEQTDVLDGFPKVQGMLLALRSMSPDVIITDEIGTEEDEEAIKELLKSGSKIITSMHGYSIEEALLKKKNLMTLFECVIFLEKRNGIPEVKACIKLWEQ